MRKLTIIEHISLDGIIQAPGGPDEDCEDGFDHGGWCAPFHDDAAGRAIDEAQGDEFDLLLGRRTYDIFASYWPHQTGPMADSLNGAHKWVVTHRPDSLSWGPATALGPDIAAGVRAAKKEGGPPLVLWGSSEVTPALIAEGLADDIVLLTFPVLLGRGKPFFGGGVRPQELQLRSTERTVAGVLINHFRPAGPLRTGTVGSEGA
ncbi:MAG: dihydrofolate reductase family protein [Parvularcula sp.]|jgi:dihydrofolate reductase|nr:dihydrofolate reductase family protein [Parvularcula sp.]